MNILALNAGSSTLKYKLFQMPSGEEKGSTEEVLAAGTETHDKGVGIVDAAEKVITQCHQIGIDAIGHRVVHGGSEFTGPTRLNPLVIDRLDGLRELDPLHNPTETAMIQAGSRMLPNVPAVAVFDTSFHATLPEVAWRYALPRELVDRLHLRRYGFHGLSHQYVSIRLLHCLGRRPEGSRLIVCHLGSGASVCALRDGKSVDTSMGMTPLEGLVMATRSGDIDPGILLYLLQSVRMTVKAVDDMLCQSSGLLGLSGLSDDVRELEKSAQSGDVNAEMALSIFASHVCKYIGAYAAILGGVDAIAFTGGIGEHSPEMRSRICDTLGFLGVEIDDTSNKKAGSDSILISTDSSTVQAWVIPTDEERQVARETYIILKSEESLRGSSEIEDRRPTANVR